MIGIRVDVNQEIATGHIKRDIAVAQCLRQMGEECLFLSADENSLPFLEPYGFASYILNSDWKDMEGELEKLLPVIETYSITSLLVDSYQVTPRYMSCLKEKTAVTYFDELYKAGYGCQQVINGVLVPPDYSKAPCRALLGPDYVSLRQEFCGLPQKKVQPEIRKILLTSGGTDNYHFCLQFLEFFLEKPRWKDRKVMVAVGGLCADKDLLQQRYADSGRVELHVNTPHMAKLLCEADYAVTAGGTTLYEVCAAGVCASCYVIGDNQLENAINFDRAGLVSYAGDFRKNPVQTMEEIMSRMEEAMPEEYRARKAREMQKIVDGRGAERIARALLEIGAPGNGTKFRSELG